MQTFNAVFFLVFFLKTKNAAHAHLPFDWRIISGAGFLNMWIYVVQYTALFQAIETGVHVTEMMTFSSFQEWANAMARRPSSVRLSVCL